MITSPRDWLADARSFNPEIPAGMDQTTYGIKRAFVRSGEDLGLEVFFEQALLLCAPRDLYHEIRIDDIRPFEDGVEYCLREVQDAVSQLPEVRVVSFEYYFDRGDELGANDFYLLDEYSSHSLSWYASSRIVETITGPSVRDYLKRADNIPLGTELEYVVKHYIHAVLLGAYIRTLRAVSRTHLPFSFAAQDDQVYMVA